MAQIEDDTPIPDTKKTIKEKGIQKDWQKKNKRKYTENKKIPTGTHTHTRLV